MGVVIYVEDTQTLWMRLVQLIFGAALAAWAVRKTTLMITKA
ncbi:hypothetical protein AB0H88_34935 [Nonomuraea sp. NPDC050680]